MSIIEKAKATIKEGIDRFATIHSKPVRKYGPNGSELADPVPKQPSADFKRPLTLTEQIRQMVRSESLREFARSQGRETFEEAEDFDVDEDMDPHSPWENEYEPTLAELIKAGRESLELKAKAAGMTLTPHKPAETEGGEAGGSKAPPPAPPPAKPAEKA